MSIQEELRISGHQPLEGVSGTETGDLFEAVLQRFGTRNIYFMCSVIYNMGRVHGIRAERARRKK